MLKVSNNLNLLLTWSNFCLPSDHFFKILPPITRTMFYALTSETSQKKKQPIEVWSWESGQNDLLKTNLTGIPSSLPLFPLIFLPLS